MRMATASRTQSTLRMGLGALLAFTSVTGCAARGNEPLEPRPTTALISKVQQMLMKPSILTWGEQELTARCMAAKGFAYQVDPPAASDDTARSPSLGGFGTPLTLEEASNGYPATQSERPAATGVESPGRTRRYQRALDREHARQVQIEIPGFALGASSRGCVATARRQLYGSVRNYLMVEYAAQGIRRFASGVLEEPQVQRAVAEYETCMRAAGYAVDNPGQAPQLAERRFGQHRLGEASAREVEMATTDALCQSRSEVYSLLDEAVADAASDWLRVTESDLEKTFEIRSKAMDRAFELRRRPVAR